MAEVTEVWERSNPAIGPLKIRMKANTRIPVGVVIDGYRHYTVGPKVDGATMAGLIERMHREGLGEAYPLVYKPLSIPYLVIDHEHMYRLRELKGR